MTFTPFGEWGWTDRTVQSNNPAAFQNPGGGLGVCPTWTVKTVCIPTAGGPDQVYRINGTTGPCGGTPSPTPTGSPSTCNSYIFNTSMGNNIDPGTTDTGNHADDGTTTINLPFSVQFYDQTFNTAIVGSNGTLGFVANGNAFTNACLPAAAEDMAILPHWDDLETVAGLPGCSTWTNGCGIFTSVTGSMPNRIFNVQWHAVFFADTSTTADFEIQLHESTNQIDFIYGDVTGGGTSATVGVQRDTGSAFTQFECNTGGITSGLGITFTCAGGGSPTPTPTGTPSCTPGWQNEPSTTVARRNPATAVSGSNLYAITGFNAAPDYTAVNERFNGASWATLAPIPVPHAQSRGAAVGTNIYVPGGYNSVSFGGPLDTMQIYNTGTDTWSAGMTLASSALRRGDGSLQRLGVHDRRL